MSTAFEARELYDADFLESLDVPIEVTVVSAHRTPDRLFDYARNAADRGLEVVIAGAVPDTTSPQCSHLNAAAGGAAPACGRCGRVMQYSSQCAIAESRTRGVPVRLRGEGQRATDACHAMA